MEHKDIRNPIRYNPLKTLDELKDFSLYLGTNSDITPNTYLFKDSVAFIFSDSEHKLFITPFRPEIETIFKKLGFQLDEKSDFNFSCVSENNRYHYLTEIARQEIMAYTYEQANQIFNEKGIKDFHLYETQKVKEVSFEIDGLKCELPCGKIKIYPMVLPLFKNDTFNCVGTYIVLDSNHVVVCENFGRTILVETNPNINNLVNTLIDCGYTRNPIPEKFIEFQKNTLT